jgi:putative ABC transport system substrate-binding protein
MRRREFLGVLGGAAATWPLAARAQQSMPVIGFLNTASSEAFADYVRAFREGLGTVGYVEGRNVAIEYRWAEGSRARVKEMAADLVRRRVDVIAATGGSPAALEAKAATATIPIVFQVGVDPIKVGLVASLTRPGGNITGATMMAVDLVPKRLELVREVVPKAASFVALFNPTGPGAGIQLHDLKAAADTLGLRMHVQRVSAESEFGAAFRSFKDLGGGALLIGADPLFNGLSAQLAALTLEYRLPAIYQFRTFAAAGGLMSYAGSITDAYYQVGVYTGRVLNGDKPADLPVHQSTKVELIINLKTAKALGITVPMPSS